MPAKVKVRIVSGRDLPVMDRASDLTDAFVEIKFGSTTYKTDVFRKSLYPQWNSDWYRFEVDDEDLQDEPLQIRVLDHDTYSSHDAIGKVYINLNPLLSKEHASVISGWFPIYDTMHGIRGELHVIVKVDLFSDFNKFRQSSCGVQFFCTSGIPRGYAMLVIYGFVEELVVNDDPEYQWIDKLRSQRASNEARQVHFTKLSGQLQRKIGLKVLEMGGNAVIGYRQCFDLEGESGVVVRGIGTSVMIAKTSGLFASPPSASPNKDSVFCPPTPTPTPTPTPMPTPTPTHSQSFRSQVPKPTSASHTTQYRLVPVSLSPVHTSPGALASLGGPSSLMHRTGSLPAGGSKHAVSLSYKSPSPLPPPAAPPAHKPPRPASSNPNPTAMATGDPPLLTIDTNIPLTISVGPPTPVASPPSPEALPVFCPLTPPFWLPAPPPLSPGPHHLPASPLLSPVHGMYGIGSSFPVPEDAVTLNSPSLTPTKLSASPAKIAVPLGRRSSESELGTPPKGSSLTGSSGSGSGSGRAPFHRPPLQQQSIDMLEYPFFTIKSFSPGFLVHIGGVVAARSVKLLDRIHNPDEPETRDAWWTELRTEIRSHARALGCHAVIGYSEQTTICGEIIILSAMGTAATVNLRSDPEASLRNNLLTMSLDRATFDREKDKDRKLHVDVNLANQAAAHRMSQLCDSDLGTVIPACSLCHIPYNECSLPYPVNLSHCCICRRNKVPDMLFTTIEPPAEFPLVGKGCLLQARICRPKKEAKGETNAKEISDSLPFMEYELHCQLQNKLKVKGMNALFGLKVQVVVGERMLVAVATATAVYAGSMPPPPIPKVLGKIDNCQAEAGLAEMRRKIVDTIVKNKETYRLYPTEYMPEVVVDVDSEDEQQDMELSADKDTFVLEIDDAEDAAVVQVLLESPVPDGFDVCSTDTMPGIRNTACNLQMFTRVWRGSLPQANSTAFTTIFDNILKSLYFKLRTMTPCCLCQLDFDVELHDEVDIQVSVTGICMGIGEPPSLTNGLVDIAVDLKADTSKKRNVHHQAADNEDMMFPMDSVVEGSLSAPLHTIEVYPPVVRPPPSNRSSQGERRIRYYSGQRSKIGIVELTPLSFLPGGRIENYLGHLDLFIIRETTSVRESGGLNGFMHSFVSEVKAICRAHVASLNGNALVAFQLSECVLDDNLHKNQSQCLVNVCGDVVQVVYDGDTAPLTSGSSPSGVQTISPLVHDGTSKRVTPPTYYSPKNSPKPVKGKRGM